MKEQVDNHDISQEGNIEVEETGADSSLQEALSEEVEKQRLMAEQHIKARKEESIEGERLRMLADMENFKKRILREQEEQSQFLTEKVISSLLPSLDNLALALQYGGDIPEAKNFYMGVEMTYKSLLEALKSFGFSVVGKVGEEFDPSIYEAVGTESKEDTAPNTVIQVIQVGYILNGRTLRPAKVILSAS